MATVRNGNKGVLLVVDVQVGVMSEAWEAARLGATHIALAGAATNWCIRATAYGALDRGYDLTLIKDAHTTGTIELDNGAKIEAETVVNDLNVAMKWLSYPGRTNGTATAEEVEFATLDRAR